MIPYNLIFQGLKTGLGVWKQRSAEKSAMKHQIEMEEISNGKIRAKRKWSLILDLFIGAFVLAPFIILILAPFAPDGMNSTLVSASDYINNGLSLLPAEYWYGFYMVVGGNFGISVSNILSNKSIVKQINKEKK